MFFLHSEANIQLPNCFNFGQFSSHLGILSSLLIIFHFYFFLGLRGNQIDMKLVLKLLTLLKDPKYFPNLLWVDLRNNNGIITIPSQFVQLLMERRTQLIALKDTNEKKKSISVQDAINGKVV